MRDSMPRPVLLRCPPAALVLCAGAILVSGARLAAQEPVPADAYQDAGARELVRLARARRATVDTRITGYQTTARERISARAGAGGLDRLLMRRETAARIDWTRDTVRVELIGGREAQPLVSRSPQMPSPFIAGQLPSLAFDPLDSEMLLRVDSTLIRHPLAAGAEAYYRYASGDSASVRLPTGRVVRLVELRITARRPDPHLINGSFWLDADSHAMVRAALRQSRALSASRRGLALLLPEASAALEHVAIEYGLVDLRWWLPRTVQARGAASVAGLRLAVEFQREYSDYRVEGDTLAPVPTPGGKGAVEPRPCRPRISDTFTIGNTPRGPAWDSVFQRAATRVGKPDSTRGHVHAGCDRAFVLTRAPAIDLVTAPVFSTGLYQPGESADGAQTLRALADAVRGIPGVPWLLSPPRVQLLSLDLLRYNRVEGFSGGARAILPLGAAELRGELRAGTTGEVGVRLAAGFEGARLRRELAGYRGLQPLDVAAQPFSLTSSTSALLLGREENDYFRASGAELRVSPRTDAWDLRLFAERQEPVRARSGGGLRGLFDDAFEARPNLAADRIGQLGTTLRLRSVTSEDPGRLRLRGEAVLDAQTGDRTFARDFLRLVADLPLGRGAAASLSAATGDVIGGEAPAQALWQIGGAGSVRGHDPASERGRQLMLWRGEVAFGPPAARLALFGDVGSAGSGGARSLRGAGAGIALLGNLLRLDVAKGSGWKAYVRMGAEF